MLMKEVEPRGSQCAAISRNRWQANSNLKWSPLFRYDEVRESDGNSLGGKSLASLRGETNTNTPPPPSMDQVHNLHLM